MQIKGFQYELHIFTYFIMKVLIFMFFHLIKFQIIIINLINILITYFKKYFIFMVIMDILYAYRVDV